MKALSRRLPWLLAITVLLGLALGGVFYFYPTQLTHLKGKFMSTFKEEPGYVVATWTDGWPLEYPKAEDKYELFPYEFSGMGGRTFFYNAQNEVIGDFVMYAENWPVGLNMPVPHGIQTFGFCETEDRFYFVNAVFPPQLREWMQNGYLQQGVRKPLDGRDTRDFYIKFIPNGRLGVWVDLPYGGRYLVGVYQGEHIPDDQVDWRTFYRSTSGGNSTSTREDAKRWATGYLPPRLKERIAKGQRPPAAFFDKLNRRYDWRLTFDSPQQPIRTAVAFTNFEFHRMVTTEAIAKEALVKDKPVMNGIALDFKQANTDKEKTIWLYFYDRDKFPGFWDSVFPDTQKVVDVFAYYHDKKGVKAFDVRVVPNADLSEIKDVYLVNRDNGEVLHTFDPLHYEIDDDMDPQYR